MSAPPGISENKERVAFNDFNPMPFWGVLRTSGALIETLLM